MIVQYWNSEEIPEHIAGCMATFREQNPEMPQLVFDEGAAEKLIAERFGARHARAFRTCAVPAMQADYFRYCAIHALGGIYVDANAACTDSLRPLFETEGQLFGDSPRVLNNVFAFRSPAHPFLELAIEVATTNIEKRVSESVALTTGPVIFGGLVTLNREGSLDPLRRTAGENWKPLVDECWEALVESFESAVGDRSSLAEALQGVRVSPRSEMLTRIHKPEYRYKTAEPHWAHWEGSIFRSLDHGNRND